MGRMGAGYGSEWQLMAYLGRRRHELSARVEAATGARVVQWLDFPAIDDERRGRRLQEWQGLDFIDDKAVLAEWQQFWPQHAGVPNWDAVARVEAGPRHEWLLIEAKAHLGEIQSSCDAKSEGLDTIRRALAWTRETLGVAADRDWLQTYYQYCNRVAVMQFLEQQGVGARLLFIYFTGDQIRGADCPTTEAGWQAALDAQDAHVGIPASSAVRQRIHKLFLPAITNLHVPPAGSAQRGTGAQ